MAGGEGSRLRPLTCTCPKPMMRLLGRPLMEYAIHLLKRHGVEDIAVTLGYLPEAVTDYFDDGADFGVNLRYYTEKEPMGTAGGVKQAQDFLSETFVVLSGDGVTDIDLAAACAFHRKRGALATLVLKRVENPLEYGVVVTGADGRVKGFYEKPGWGDVLSDTVNTGIYILEPEILNRIPADRPCDFGRELFPALVAEGAPVFGYVTEAYWCDVGDTDAYLRAHIDALDGNIQLEPLLDASEKITRAPGAQIDRRAVIEGPCYIGENAVIHAGAKIGEYSVIGANACVGARAGVKRSVLLDGASVLENAQARGCILGPGACLEAGAQAFEGSVIGAGSAVGARATVTPGVKIWPQKRIPDGERRATNLVWGADSAERREGSRLSDREYGPAGSLLLCGPDHAVRAAQAYAAQMHPQEVLLAHTGSAVAAAMQQACAAGLASQGVQVIDAGRAPLPQLRHMQRAACLESAALVSESGFLALDKHGSPLSRRALRSISTLLMRQDYPAPFSGIVRPAVRNGGGEWSYVGATAALFAEKPEKAPSVAVFAADNALLTLAEKSFMRAGIRVRAEWEEELMVPAENELAVWLLDGGEEAVFATAPANEKETFTLSGPFEESFGTDDPPPCCFALPHGDPFGKFSEAEMQLMRAWIALERGEKLLVEPVSATRTLNALAERYGARVEYTTMERALWLGRLAEISPLQFLLHTDGIALAMLALNALAHAGITAAQWRQAMPETHRHSRTLAMGLSQRGRILRALAEAEEGAELGGGVRFPRENGWTWICPDDAGEQCRIVSEGMNEEYARELCDFYETKIGNLLKNPEG